MVDAFGNKQRQEHVQDALFEHFVYEMIADMAKKHSEKIDGTPE